jgi:hypothetical protein
MCKAINIPYAIFLVFALLTGCKNHAIPSKKSTEEYCTTIKKYLTKEYNQEIAFYADLTKHSSGYRFFVLNLKNNSILKQGLCCNGKTNICGNVKYSNVSGSGCSSKGFYRIGNPYKGKFGKAYKLNGLQNTNNNAFKRAVVLHSHRCVPENPTFARLAESDGCPTVNSKFFNELDAYISQSNKPILLYIE